MFSLIITIISIALVAALALATIYYGGSLWNKLERDARQINNGNFTKNTFANYDRDFWKANKARHAY
jgi:hypothetical protein